MDHISTMAPAWIESESLDANLVARIAHEMADFLRMQRFANAASPSGLALEAAEIFQRFHFSFDPIYWDDRNFPAVVSRFVHDALNALRAEPTWINDKYSTGIETLIDLLRRHQIASDAIVDSPSIMPRR